MVKIQLNSDQLSEVFQLTNGAFSPLTSFMTKQEFNSCVETMKLPDGMLFPLPITFSVDHETRENIRHKNSLELCYQGLIVGRLEIEDIYRCDKLQAANKIFGTADFSHPGVSNFCSSPDYFIGGRITSDKETLELLYPNELTPLLARRLFKSNGWETVAGFQTRNVPHRAHEYLQRTALEYVDGLFIQPLIGRRKSGDYTSEAIIKGYDALISEFYPARHVEFATLRTAMRYAGPREALFHALIRKNYGCTHFIVGRDHAGVGDFYEKYQAQKICLEHEEDLGIKILDFKGPFFCEACNSITTEKTCAHVKTAPKYIKEISGTMMRNVLMGGERPDPNLMRPEIIAALMDTKLFIDGEN